MEVRHNQYSHILDDQYIFDKKRLLAQQDLSDRSTQYVQCQKPLIMSSDLS